jgi:hypothetical protein
MVQDLRKNGAYRNCEICKVVFPSEYKNPPWWKPHPVTPGIFEHWIRGEQHLISESYLIELLENKESPASPKAG